MSSASFGQKVSSPHTLNLGPNKTVKTEYSVHPSVRPKWFGFSEKNNIAVTTELKQVKVEELLGWFPMGDEDAATQVNNDASDFFKIVTEDSSILKYAKRNLASNFNSMSAAYV